MVIGEVWAGIAIAVLMGCGFVFLPSSQKLLQKLVLNGE